MFRTLLENGILLYVQDPPEKWDFTFCSGPSWKMGFYFLFRTLLKNEILLSVHDLPEK